MPSHIRLISYDSLEDADIHEFFQSLPDRQASKYIRIAIRLLIKKMDEDDRLKPQQQKEHSQKKMLSYDSLEDADVHEFLQSLPDRQASKYIRIAIRLLIKKMDEDDRLKPQQQVQIPSNNQKKETEFNENKHELDDENIDKNDFVDNNDILNLGK